MSADIFTWDSADRLISATVAGTTATMSFDGTDNLVAKTVGGSTTRYVYDRNLPLAQLLTAGDSTYQYGPGMAASFGPMMQEAAGTKNWLHDDALASVRFTTNSSGTSIGSSTYDAFGSQRQQTGQQNFFRFAGQEQHADIGLIHMRARWYDPATGRFISRDPIKGSATVPQSLNPYAYVSNNPCNLRDPSGLDHKFGAIDVESGFHTDAGMGAGSAVGLGLGQAASGSSIGSRVFGSAGGSTCFAVAAYKPVWVWKDPPKFNWQEVLSLDLPGRFAAVAAFLEASKQWAQELVAANKQGPTWTKVAEHQGCLPQAPDLNLPTCDAFDLPMRMCIGVGPGFPPGNLRPGPINLSPPGGDEAGRQGARARTGAPGGGSQQARGGAGPILKGQAGVERAIALELEQGNKDPRARGDHRDLRRPSSNRLGY